MVLVDTKWKKDELYAECKRRGIAGCCAFNKDSLIRTLNKGINELTKKELIAECIQRGLRKYGQLNKPELVRLLEEDIASAVKPSTSVDVDIASLTEKQLKAECRRVGLRNICTLDKAELVKLLKGRSTNVPPPPSRPPYRRNDGVPKTGPLQPIAQTAFDHGPTKNDKPGCLYVYSQYKGVKNEWKVGMTTQNPPERRVKDAERNNNTVYELKRSWPVCLPKFAEKIVHRELHSYSVRRKLKEGGREWADGGKEWFQVDYGIVEARIQLVVRMISANYP